MTGEPMWISPKEAAHMLGYSEHYFRRTFCRGGVVGITVMRLGQRGWIKVLRADVLRLAFTD